MYRIMIVEDEEPVREELGVMLRNAMYEVEEIAGFENPAEQILKAAPDLVLLDITLPGRDGFGVCRELRRSSDIPVIFLTGRNTAMDELNGIIMGGDDYIAKPFYAPVLLARIGAVLKRTAKSRAEKDRMRFEVKGCTLNLLDGTLFHEGKKEELTRNEARICYCLFGHEGKIVPREEIMDDLWDNHIFIDDNTLSVHVAHIRKKLEALGLPGFIVTKRGQGYLV